MSILSHPLAAPDTLTRELNEYGRSHWMPSTSSMTRGIAPTTSLSMVGTAVPL